VHLILYLPVLFQLFSDVRPAAAPRPDAVRTVGACALVTRADVEQALGRSVGHGKEQTEGADSSCDYAGGKGQVTIPESRVRSAAGIGMVAFFLDIAEDGTQLHVIRGERDYLLVSVLGFGDAAQVSPAAERMARKALTRF
jgi:hypothetical protein